MYKVDKQFVIQVLQILRQTFKVIKVMQDLVNIKIISCSTMVNGSSVFCNLIDGEKSTGCFTLNVFLMSCGSQYFVAFPYGAEG